MNAVSMCGVADIRYDALRDWGRLPVGMQFGTISSIAVDSHDNVYVFQRGRPPLLIFSPDGHYIGGWADLVADAHGIFITPDDQIFLVDRDGHRVHKFGPDGRLLLTIGNGIPTKGAPFNCPADVAISQQGDIFVADGYGNSLIHRFSSEGRHLLSWGSPGRGPGELSVPHGIWVDGRNEVFVADRDNHRIQVFTTDGTWLRECTDVYQPTDIFGGADGILYVTDLSTRVHMLDLDGNVVARGRSGYPGHGVWGDSHGNLFFVSTSSARVEKCIRRVKSTVGSEGA